MVEPLERPVSSYVSKQFVMVDENVSVANAVKLTQPKNIETIIVTSNGKPVGIVTDSDILEKVVIKGDDSDLVFLKSIMTSPILTLHSTSSLKQAIELMRIRKIKRVPIVDSHNKSAQKIIGIVTQKFLAEAIRTSVIEKTFKSYRVSIKENYKPIFGNLGFIMQFAGILMIVPAIFGTILNELESAASIYLAVISMSLTGFILNTLGEKSTLNLKQSSIVVVSSFTLLSLYGSLPYMYVNPFELNFDYLSLFVSSILESSSGYTTTGISTIENPESLPESFVFYRSYTQWVGGLSFVYLVMALYYPETKLATMRNMIGGGILKFKQLLSTISIIFVFYTIIFILLIFFLGNIHLIESVSLSFTTLVTGGFIPDSTIFDSLNSSQLIVIMAGMMIAALPFGFHYGIFSKEVKSRFSMEIIVYLFFILLFAVLFVIIEPSISTHDWLTSLFHVVSASTTTGFSFINLSYLSLEGKLFLILIMLVGGTAFSTAGGIKIARLLLILQKLKGNTIFLSMSDAFTPLSISSTAIQFRKHRNGQKFSISKKNVLKSKNELVYHDSQKISLLSDKAFRDAIFVIILFVILSLTSATTISYLNKSDFVDALFESSAALSNTGFSVGITTMDLDLVSKLILSINMVLGRFEIIALLYIFISRLRK
ncbi:MAG TPA: potassium transporter TrkG [Nitrososphaeraceae archaeon]|nr:potassium transporter TrkG [Nitrososphaeraceae archaeon]